MSEIQSVSYIKVIHALQRAGFVVVRQRGSHIRLQKRTFEEIIKLTAPAHKPIVSEAEPSVQGCICRSRFYLRCCSFNPQLKLGRRYADFCKIEN